MLLPCDIDPEEFDTRFRLDFEAWRPAVEEVCVETALPASQLRPFRDGSNLVAAVAERWVVKLFPPFHRGQWESERLALTPFQRLRSLRVPELLAVGERDDGYRYVVVELLPGVPLHSMWPRLDLATRARLLEQIGATMAEAHTLPLGEAAHIEPPWEALFQDQLARCRARHTKLGAPDWVVEHVDAFTKRALDGVALDGPRVLLTGEYTPFNLLVTERDGSVELTGMIDFADSFVGPPHYDLLGPLAFLCGGEAALVRAFLDARGLVRWPPSAEEREGLLALLLLHRYSNLDVQLRVPGWRDVGSLERLAARLLAQADVV
jgi:hygromycin-B 7''-O-kinase